MKGDFQSFVRKMPSGCIEWIGTTVKSNGRDSHRCGRFTVNGKKVLSHRYAYEMIYGAIPPGMLVCHRCDNTKCCNPDHLFLGTHKENMQDMSIKGRRAGIPNTKPARGEKVFSSKLTEKSVIEIRRLRSLGITTVKIGQMFSVDSSVISRIANRKSWSHI